MVRIVVILKRGFFEGLVKKKGAWSFWGKQRKDERRNIKTRYNKILQFVAYTIQL